MGQTPGGAGQLGLGLLKGGLTGLSQGLQNQQNHAAYTKNAHDRLHYEA